MTLELLERHDRGRIRDLTDRLKHQGEIFDAYVELLQTTDVEIPETIVNTTLRMHIDRTKKLITAVESEIPPW